MRTKLVSTLLLVALAAVFCGVASADQITIGPTVSGDNVIFSNSGGVTRMGFTGGVLTGTAFYPDTSPLTGTYWFTFGSGTLPSITLVSPYSYSVAMGTAPLTLKVCIVTCANEVDGDVYFQQASSFNPKAPQISGVITVTNSTGILANDFAVGPGGQFDFDVNLSAVNASRSIDWVYTHSDRTVQGPLSSGEVIGVPTPEPGSMALLGSGFLGLAGFLRRRR